MQYQSSHYHCQPNKLHDGQTNCYVLQWPQYVHQTHIYIFTDYSLRWPLRSIFIHLIYCLAVFFGLRRRHTIGSIVSWNPPGRCNMHMHTTIGRYDSVLNQTTTKSFSYYYHSKWLLVRPFTDASFAFNLSNQIINITTWSDVNGTKGFHPPPSLYFTYAFEIVWGLLLNFGTK